MDKFQERYEQHIKRKNDSLIDFDGNDNIQYSLLEQTALKEMMINRRSQRIFNNDNLSITDITWIKQAIKTAPSSCNRQAIYIKSVNPKEIEKFLVGGKRWIDNANTVFLIFASRHAYKNPVEIPYMPYLDAGFVGQNIYLMCEALNIGCCFVNPNIVVDEQSKFDLDYNKEDNIFCGAVALGYYDLKSKMPPLRSSVNE